MTCPSCRSVPFDCSPETQTSCENSRPANPTSTGVFFVPGKRRRLDVEQPLADRPVTVVEIGGLPGRRRGLTTLVVSPAAHPAAAEHLMPDSCEKLACPGVPPTSWTEGPVGDRFSRRSGPPSWPGWLPIRRRRPANRLRRRIPTRPSDGWHDCATQFVRHRWKVDRDRAAHDIVR